ncbi:NADPH-dependent glutamate synthase [[Eubacterium] cellulosolvens]
MGEKGQQEKSRAIQRQKVRKRKPVDRITDFNEVSLGFDEAEAKLEASRCIQCPNPKCIVECPVGIDIPRFIEHIKKNDFTGAANVIRERNGIPRVTGRVCPQEKLCEAVCILSKTGQPIAIGTLERFAADRGEDIDILQREWTGKKVAIIGSGPASLTAAVDLAKLGHKVIIFEALHEPGGVLVYGIPAFRLPKEIMKKTIDYVKSLGIKLERNIVIGKSMTIDELFGQGYDAIFIGSGAGSPKFLGIPGENLNGVLSANEFLTRCNLMRAYKFPERDTPVYVGEKVAVIGGGNVAMDSARTVRRLGAKEVYVVYRRTEKEMPARVEEVENAKDENIQFMMLTNPVKIIGDAKGYVNGLECLKMQLGEPDDSGRRKPITIEGSNFTLNLDMVIVAIGQGPNPIIRKTTPNLKVNDSGYIVVDGRGRTTHQRIWAAGDIVPDSATVIEAMCGAKNAARDMHLFLSKEKEGPWIS